jgi:steroid delta-isomerase-like uncharacterized protein
MSTETNKATVRSYFERAINQNDLAWLEQIIGPEFGSNHLGGPGDSGGLTGPARARAAIEHWRRAFPDIHYAVEDLLAEGDRVVARVTFQGTHRGEFLGVPATGRVVTVSGVELAVLAGGQIVAAGWQFHDELGLLRQLGALPAQGHGQIGASHGPH